MSRQAIPLCLGLTLLASAGLAAQDAAAVAPTLYKVLLDDDRVRVMEVTFKPGAEMGLHTHLETVGHILAPGKLRITYADGKVEEIEFKVGQTLRMPADSPHTTKNVGKTTLRALMTELKEAPPSAALTGGERTEILDLYERSGSELQSLVARTADELWAKRPAADRWSVAEVVEHLAIVENALNGFILQTLSAPADPNWAVVETSRPIDGILRGGTDRSKKFQSPEFAMPKGGQSRGDLLGSWGGARAQNAELVRRTTAEVKRHTADVPNGGKMTMHQLMAYVAIHNLRHNQQIAEVLAQLQK